MRFSSLYLLVLFSIPLFSLPPLLSYFFLLVYVLKLSQLSCMLAPFCNARRVVYDTARPLALPLVCTGLLQLHDTKRDGFSDQEATPACLSRPAPTTTPHARYISANAVLRLCPHHQAAMHARYDTQQALPFLCLPWA